MVRSRTPGYRQEETRKLPLWLPLLLMLQVVLILLLPERILTVLHRWVYGLFQRTGHLLVLPILSQMLERLYSYQTTDQIGNNGV